MMTSERVAPSISARQQTGRQAQMKERKIVSNLYIYMSGSFVRLAAFSV